MRKQRIHAGTMAGIILITFMAILSVAPLVYMILMSFTQSRSMTFHLKDLQPDLKNYYTIFFKNSFGRSIFNSLLVAVFSCLWTDLVCVMGAYGFEKKNFRGKETAFRIMLLTLMIPSQVTLIPLFLEMRAFRWLNTYAALIIPMPGAFGVFLIRQFLKGVDDTYIEAAQIDGCPEFSIFYKIIVPLVQPAIMSLTIFTFVSVWNSFTWPLVVNTDTRMYTFTVALSLLNNQHDTNYGLSMAASAVSFFVPFAMYLVLQNSFIEGVAAGGVKG